MEYTITDLDISNQAWAVLAYLKGERTVKGSDAYVYCLTSAWYNCRERGFSLTVSNFGTDNLVVTFGEHRSSDGIFVDHWLAKSDFNPPTVKDFTDEAYENRKMFRYGDVIGASDYITDLIEEYILSADKETGKI